jgi:hypothetical protein
VAGAYERYTKQLYARWRYFATWLPNAPIAVGDVGIVEGKLFQRVTSLKELGIPATVGPSGAPANYQHSSAGQVEVSAGGSADLAAAGGTAAPSATLSIRFKRAGATLFQAVDCVEESLSDLPGLERHLRESKQAGAWRAEYVVVHKLIRSGPAAIFVSEESDATVELRSSGGLEAGTLSVAHAAGALTVVRKSGEVTAVMASVGLTPLFGLGGLRSRRSRDDAWNFMADPAGSADRAAEGRVADVSATAVGSGTDNGDLALRELDWDDFATQ